MTEEPQPVADAPVPAPESAAFASEPAPTSSGPAAGADDRPEIAVGAAFAGGFLAALILKRLGR